MNNLEKLEEAKKEKFGIFVKNFISDINLPTWEDFLKNIYIETKKDWDGPVPNVSEMQKRYGNLIALKGFYFSINNNIEWHPSIIKIRDRLREAIDQTIMYNGSVVSLADVRVPGHTDDWHAIGIQILGNSEWTVFDSQDSSRKHKDTFLVEPGDLVIAPRGAFHKVYRNEPSASLLFDFGWGSRRT